MKLFRGTRLFPGITVGIVLAGAMAVLLAGGAFVVKDFLQIRGNVQTELSTIGDAVAGGSATALSLRDREGASRTLWVLRGDEMIATAALYLRDEVKPLASYHRSGTDALPLPPLRQPGIYAEGKSVLLIQSVVLNGQVVGTLAMRAGVDAMTSRLPRDLSVTTLMLTCMLIGVLYTLRLPWIVAQPAVATGETGGSDPLDGVRLGNSAIHEMGRDTARSPFRTGDRGYT